MPVTRITRSSRWSLESGMSLLELTVVILVMLSLVSILFVGAWSWKRGSDRAICIVNIHNVQKGVRGYSNLYGFEPGANAPGLQSQVIGLGRFVEATPRCPGNGNYSYGTVYGGDTVPPMGAIYLDCSNALTFDHVPQNHSEW